MSIQESPSYRVEDGMLLDEIDELALDGGDKVPSAATDEDETLVNLPAPEAEAGLPIKRESMEDTESPCELDMRGRCKFPGKISQCKHSKYKKTESADFVKDVMKPAKNDDASGGLIWKANIVPDDFDKHFKKKGTLKMCSINNYDAKNHCIKPRRGNLLVKESDFFGSLVQLTGGDEIAEIDDFDIFEKKDRWVFSGVLCGFPSLKTLEVLKIECKRSLPLSNWATHWKSGKDDGVPTFPKGFILAEVRVILRSPPYSMNGWAKDSRGFVFWFEGNNVTRKEPRVTYGTNIIRQFEKESIGKPSPKCVKVHMISHRYATGDSLQIRDRFTYHSLALLEWDHGQYCTVLELAYLGGIGGYLGRSNWIEDKMEPVNSFYKVVPPEMIHPWKNNLSEIRVYDVKAKNLKEHMEFMKLHTGPDKRFVDVKVTFTHPVRLTFSSREHIAQYLINYISRGKTYSEIRANCQTFAADFCAFLAGKKDVQPYHPINRVQYHNQSHYFLYEPSMY